MSKQLVVLDTSTGACCEPLAVAALDAGQAETLAPMFKALGDPIRLRLLSMITSAEGGEACVCDLTPQFGVSGPTISHHLRVLREAGLIEGDRRGTWVWYRPMPAAMRALAAVLAAPTGAGL
jgi:ArsR family transcriptional regulator